MTFVHVNVNMTWMEARQYCRGRHTDLASVRNMAENRRLQVLVPTGQRAWIGLSRESWKWSDGTGSAFSFWMSGEPSKTRQNCAAANMKDSGRWQNFCCTEKKPSVCSAGTKWLFSLVGSVLVLFRFCEKSIPPPLCIMLVFVPFSFSGRCVFVLIRLRFDSLLWSRFMTCSHVVFRQKRLSSSDTINFSKPQCFHVKN